MKGAKTLFGHRIRVVAPFTIYGELEILDIQPEMLEHTIGKARSRGLTNVSSTEADAARLPQSDESFDAASIRSPRRGSSTRFNLERLMIGCGT
jgi:hypothetical protein